MRESKSIEFDFSYESYEIMLKILKKDYNFVGFNYAKSNLEKLESNNVILRHDIDQSIEKAVKISEIEANQGVKSTYFIFLRSPFYNVFKPNTEVIIKEIIDMGHRIGLHYDYSITKELEKNDFLKKLEVEVNVMSDFFGVEINEVSFHRPHDINVLKKMDLGSLSHSYETIFLEKFNYFSDSRGLWRFGHPLESDAFKNKQNIQILTHPIWWNHHNLSAIKSIKLFEEFYLKSFNESLHSELKGFWDHLNKN